MTTLVSIVSEQTLPNYLFIKQLQGQVHKFLFLTTEAMERQSKTNLICETAGIEKSQRIKTNISDDILNQSIEKLGKLNLSPDDNYLVNLTGGTKMMSIAVWRFFHHFTNSRFFYVPIGKGVYHELFDDRPAQSYNFTYNLSVKEYLSIYGIRFKNEKLLFTNQEVLDIFNDLKAGNFDPEKFPGKKLQKFQLSYNIKQIHTKWYEEYVYYKIKNELRLDDNQIVTGVKLFQSNEEKKVKFYANDNEVDVLFIYHNRPYIIECKFSIGKKNINTTNLAAHIYKLAAVNKRFGLSARASIFTLSDLSEMPDDKKLNYERRLAITGVHPVCDRTVLLKNFRNYLDNFLK